MITQKEMEKLADEFAIITDEYPAPKEIKLTMTTGSCFQPFTSAQMRLFITTLKLLSDNGIEIKVIGSVYQEPLPAKS